MSEMLFCISLAGNVFLLTSTAFVLKLHKKQSSLNFFKQSCVWISCIAPLDWLYRLPPDVTPDPAPRGRLKATAKPTVGMPPIDRSKRFCHPELNF